MPDNQARENLVEGGVPLYVEGDEVFDPSHFRKLRLKAAFLLAIFLLPTILIAVEVLTGSLSRSWEELIEPFLNDPRILHF